MNCTLALCDDNPGQQADIVTLLSAYPSARLSVRVFNNAAELLACADSFDLYLLDIIMPGLDGIALARQLRARETDTPIVFLTSSADYALDAFSVSALHYLLKPVTRAALFDVLDKFIAAREKADGFIMVQTRDSTRRISFASIVYVELWGRAMRFALKDGETLVSRAVRVPFAAAIAPLLADARFLYAHKSYALNMERVNELRPRAFIMADGTEIPIPRSKYAEAKSRYFDFLSSRGIGMVSHAP